MHVVLIKKESFKWSDCDLHFCTFDFRTFGYLECFYPKVRKYEMYTFVKVAQNIQKYESTRIEVWK